MSKKVLLVEDEPNITEALRFILLKEGYFVDTHADGRTALDAILKKQPDVLVLDVMLPGRSGYDILQDLRAMPETKGLPVLMLTARGQKREVDLAERYGVNRFMTKPFANADILTSVKELAGL